MKEAMFWEKLKKNKMVQCHLCPWDCKITEGKLGNCGVRKNKEGKLYSLNYAKPCTVSIDPIEKKPFFHFHPGSRTVSVATVGCNFHCKFCQNWEISQAKIDDIPYRESKPKKIVDFCLENDCEGVSYTYTEPTIFYEYAYDTAKLAHEQGLYNTFVSNGYINEKPLRKISKYLDAMNLDLKAFTDEYYKELCGVPSVEPVKKTAKLCKELGIFLEVTTLIIPGYNDNESDLRKLSKFVYDLGEDTPLHFSRFSPFYKMKDTPETELKTLRKARNIALEEGLNYVYIGNVFSNEAENTYCPNCGETVIGRVGFNIKETNLTKNKCSNCGEEINLLL
ncbi:MAG: AmmeMemoRadiSam system radical SAM enzyme [Candidatus Undinarchaeales archaeon]